MIMGGSNGFHIIGDKAPSDTEPLVVQQEPQGLRCHISDKEIQEAVGGNPNFVYVMPHYRRIANVAWDACNKAQKPKIQEAIKIAKECLEVASHGDYTNGNHRIVH